jgi:hypothetical protein
MKTIEYRVQYTGATNETTREGAYIDTGQGTSYEVVRVDARNINSGYRKALKKALEPLGSGVRREIGAIEFWQVI